MSTAARLSANEHDWGVLRVDLLRASNGFGVSSFTSLFSSYVRRGARFDRDILDSVCLSAFFRDDAAAFVSHLPCLARHERSVAAVSSATLLLAVVRVY